MAKEIIIIAGCVAAFCVLMGGLAFAEHLMNEREALHRYERIEGCVQYGGPVKECEEVFG